MIYCTVVTNQYLTLAITMAKSVKKMDKNAKIVVCLVEEDLSYASQFASFFDDIVLAKHLGISNFYSFIFKHNSFEAPCACKPRIIKYSMDKFPSEHHFIYIDSDVKVFSGFDKINNLLNQYAIILTPHILKEDEFEFVLYPCGAFNAGFLALNRSDEAIQFLNWWMKKVEENCYFEIENGLFVDQKWLDLVPAYYKGAYILKDPGYNVASWNLTERDLQGDLVRGVKANNHDLIFFHFSGILRLKQDYHLHIRKFEKNNQSPVYSIINNYLEDLVSNGHNFGKEIPWSYDRFSSGEVINNKSRVVYRRNIGKFSKIVNPFLKSNKRFLKVIRQKGKNKGKRNGNKSSK